MQRHGHAHSAKVEITSLLNTDNILLNRLVPMNCSNNAQPSSTTSLRTEPSLLSFCLSYLNFLDLIPQIRLIPLPIPKTWTNWRTACSRTLPTFPRAPSLAWLPLVPMFRFMNWLVVIFLAPMFSMVKRNTRRPRSPICSVCITICKLKMELVRWLSVASSLLSVSVISSWIHWLAISPRILYDFVPRLVFL